MNNDAGMRIKVARIMRGWTQHDLAQECAGRSEETVTTWQQVLVHIENGRVIPAGEYARILEEVLGETVPNLGTEKEE